MSERLPNIKDIKEVNFYNPDAFFITVTTSAAASYHEFEANTLFHFLRPLDLSHASIW